MNRRRQISEVRNQVERLHGLSDDELRRFGIDLRYEAMCGSPATKLIGKSFALVVEASRRSTGIIHHDVQLMCGIEMANGRIAEMRTGEGKTLTASLVAHLFALYGRGVHVVTFNDYLAGRDCSITGPIFSRLGLSSSVLTPALSSSERKAAYRCDITYGATKEFGFDYLRDRLAMDQSGDISECVMRGTDFALVDEADSILIDEARSPLIIGVVDPVSQNTANECGLWAALHAPYFLEAVDYTYETSTQFVELTAKGIRKLRELPETPFSKQVSIQQLYGYIKNAIKAMRDFHLDKHYAIRDGKIVIIDELTGRLAEGRKWQQGIHQAIEAKERLLISESTKQAAMITIPSFFHRYRFLCGMTGTASTSRLEFAKVYKKKVRVIPTHHPLKREEYPAKVFATLEEKYAGIIDEIEEIVSAGRSVLVGTRTVAASERLSFCLTQRNIAHSVLNAHHLEKEANVIEQAGLPGRVTVATNMAGRGTDIKLAKPVRDAGGLHVILSELNENQRIDWQLIGRGSRQGDPGSFRIFLSLEDDILLVGHGVNKTERIKSRFGKSALVDPRKTLRYFLSAQRRTERKQMIDRLRAVRQDVDRWKANLETGKDVYLNAVNG